MKNKITDLNIKQVKPKDSHFKEFKITYKYKGKPISDFRVFDKNISKSNDELLKTVTKEINDNLENGKLAKYALKFTGFTKKVTVAACTVVVIGAGVGTATPLIINAFNKNEPIVPDGYTLTLNAGELGYFGEKDKKQFVIEGIKEGTTLRDALASDDKYAEPITDDKITPQGETTPIPYSFNYYADNDGKEVDNNFVINENVTLTANYDLACLSFVVPEDSGDDVLAYASSKQYIAPAIEPEIKYVSATNPSGTWSNFPKNGFDAITIHKGEKIYLKGNNPSGFSFIGDSSTNYTNFNLSATNGGDAILDAYGNIMSLLDDGASSTTAIPCKGCFRNLFTTVYDGGLSNPLRRAPNLPATTLMDYCYDNMFYGCTYLKHAPNLLADNLTIGCYRTMFRDCAALENAPVIAGQTCDENSTQSFFQMFTNCASLKIAPDIYLSSEELESKNAFNMFEAMCANCYKLEKLTVHFGIKGTDNWPGENNTKNWLTHAGEQAENQPVFEWYGASENIPDDNSHVPQTRTVEGQTVPFWKIVTIEK